MIDKKQLIEELLDCVKDATDTETQITGLSMCAMLMNEVLDEALTIPVVVVSEAELCDNPHCEDGVVDSDMYGHPIYCQVCDKHN